MDSITKMEGIKPTAKLFGVPEHYIRTLVKEGKIKAVRVSDSANAKILVNIQSVNDYFNSCTLGDEPVDEQVADLLLPRENSGKPYKDTNKRVCPPRSRGIQPIPVKL